jgi:hypothetical protein
MKLAEFVTDEANGRYVIAGSENEFKQNDIIVESICPFKIQIVNILGMNLTYSTKESMYYELFGDTE